MSTKDSKNVPFSTSTIATTVIRSQDGTKIVSDTAVTPPAGAAKPITTQSSKELPASSSAASLSAAESASTSAKLAPQKPVFAIDHPPRRAPIEEAMIPQPRPAATVDTEHDPRLFDTVAEKLSRVVTSVKEGAEGVTEKIKSVSSTVAQKTDEVAASATRATGNLVSGTGNKMEEMSERSEQRAKFRSERAKEHDAMAKEHYLRAKQPFNYSNGSRPKEWTSEDEAILLQIRKEIQEKRSSSSSPRSPRSLVDKKPLSMPSEDSTRNSANWTAAAPSSRYDSKTWNNNNNNSNNTTSATKKDDDVSVMTTRTTTPLATTTAGASDSSSHDNDHHGAMQSIKDWLSDHWYSNSHPSDDDSAKPFPTDGHRTAAATKPPAWSDFEEGADMAKDEASKRLQRVARDTETKLDAARRAAELWEHEAQEQVADAYANARSHAQQLLKQAESYHAPGSLAKSLQQLKLENARLKSAYVHEICNHHPDRGHCFEAMKHITGLAKENTRIKIALSDKHLKNH